MPRKPDSGRIHLIEVFRRVQTQMLSDLSVGGRFEHASSAGAATEHHWINLFERYLPRRYRAAPAFLLDRLRDLGTAPAADLMEYGRALRSFRR
jgi:hypothetical protein